MYLEDVEGLELDIATLVLQQVHHQLQVVGVGNVPRHDRKVSPV